MGKTRSRAVVLVGLTISAAACAQTGHPSQLLECSGSMSWEGHNAPKDAVIPAAGQATGRFTLSGTTLEPSSAGDYPARKLTLCSSTVERYVFSSDCTANPRTYISDWLQETDFDTQTSPFFKSHRNSMFDLDIVRMDRVSLVLVETYYANDNRIDIRGPHITNTPYVVSSRFVATCHVAKPKI
ncbi:hypothetical protein QZM46_08370 [Burkholderia vietnamiensis]|uniref:Lipoprotein n=3 Tax=Burkholderia cepacia complex TaxID=87882 RepID=A0AAW7SZD2_BURVI|nr:MULTISPECIES: hypothetical protein [Burkholderia]AIO71618.1 hypothetical protein DM80_6084 [Burkholderia multivorans]AXK68112.1 hypothetical protein DCN14_36480 [Burkholderia sp. IDO3]MBH9646510.1 hypothetical protein [Burkholderia vietnamiensis]MBR7913116.1 hypothetical protein [Burkholderia vietnamiensis]MBR8003421.1 hypothetical protein [Burkholderia vietnamiensis]